MDKRTKDRIQAKARHKRLVATAETAVKAIKLSDETAFQVAMRYLKANGCTLEIEVMDDDTFANPDDKIWCAWLASDVADAASRELLTDSSLDCVESNKPLPSWVIENCYVIEVQE